MKKNDCFSLLYSQLWLHKDSVLANQEADSVCNQLSDTSVKDQIKEILLQPVTNNLVQERVVSSWESLIPVIQNCTNCKLSDSRNNVVIERGSRNAKIMFVGEGPGEREDLQGIPFVGRSGELLNKMIAAMHLDKAQDVYICNVVKCRPPNNRNPLPEEITSCFEYLHTQIRWVNPSVIIALGRIASNALLRNQNSLTSLRGRVHCFEQYPLIATYHPASLLRNPAYKAYAWEDLQLALRVLQP